MSVVGGQVVGAWEEATQATPRLCHMCFLQSETRNVLPDPLPDPLRDASPDPTPNPPPSPPHFVPNFNPLYLVALIPALLMFPVLIWCIWRLCCKKEPEEKTCCVRKCPTMIVPCGCQTGEISRMEGRYINFTLVKPPCGQLSCGPKICLAPSQECFPNSCCSRCQHPQPICSRPPSRMLPLIPPPARTLYGATLSISPQ
ncbi:hypothetical protein HPG69_015404 [Diceros bicornis minor]|uniref:Uncharacterized protein n=1 Tax=Diceros bicornis minor TaxID=77932 RepID=A0A7J7F2E2_DICBM|nr:hypothetical protein HPG69_015404 [Diceros bicornis minor]